MKVIFVCALTISCLLGLILVAEAGEDYGYGGGLSGWGSGWRSGWGSGFGSGYGSGYGKGSASVAYVPYYGGYGYGAGSGGAGNGGFFALIGLIFIILILFGTGFNRTTPNQTVTVIGG